jgi:hypothetical protein
MYLHISVKAQRLCNTMYNADLFARVRWQLTCVVLKEAKVITQSA